MIEQGLLNKHFVGRDGFHWWIGQIPNEETWRENLPAKTEANVNSSDYKGFSERFKVRIMGYHTALKSELPDEDLPWATVMYPVTAGGGGGFSSQSANLNQGDFVYGFFLDGEDGQQPVIMGVIGNNSYEEVMRGIPDTGFVPFQGFNSADYIPAGGVKEAPGGQTIPQDKKVSSASLTDKTQQSPEALNDAELASQTANDTDKSETNPAPIANANDPLPAANIQQNLQNVIIKIEELRKLKYKAAEGILRDLGDVEAQINKELEKAAEWIASSMKWVYEQIEQNVIGKINEAMKFAYDLAFPAERQAVKKATNTIVDKISCFFRKLMGQLFEMMLNFLKDAIDRVINVSECFVDKFVGGVLGTISGTVSSAMGAITDLISGAVDLGGEVLDLGSDIVNMVQDILSFLDCDDRPRNSEVNNWSVLSGTGQFSASSITGIIDRAKGVAEGAQELGFDALDSFNSLTDIDFEDIFAVDQCNVREQLCGAPLLQIIGAGAGAAGNLVIGEAGEILGVDMISFGAGFDENTKMKVFDPCGRGSGAVIRPVFGVNDNRSNTPTPGGGTPANTPQSVGLGPFAPQRYRFDPGPGPAISPQPFNPSGKAYGTPFGGSGGGTRNVPFKKISKGNNKPGCIDVKFTISKKTAKQNNRILFRLIDAEPGFVGGFDYTGNDAGRVDTQCIEPEKKYLVTGYYEDGREAINPLKLIAPGPKGNMGVGLDEAKFGYKNKTTTDTVLVDREGRTEYPITFKTTARGFGSRLTKNGTRLEYDDNAPNGFDLNASFEIKSVSPKGNSARFTNDGSTLIVSGPDTRVTLVLELETDDDPDDRGTAIEWIEVGGRRFETGEEKGRDEKAITFNNPPRKIKETVSVPVTVEKKPKFDGDYDDLMVIASDGKFFKKKGKTYYILRLPEDPDGPGEGEPFPPAPPGIGVPSTPGGIGTPGSQPGIGPFPGPGSPGDPPFVGPGPTGPTFPIIDVLVIDPGDGYLPGPDGSKGGGGRTWSRPDDTIITHPDGTIEVPIPPGNYFCVDIGDIVTLPVGTSVVTEPAGELIVGGSPHTITKGYGCFETPFADIIRFKGDYPTNDGNYPVMLYLCDIIIDTPGVGYQPDDQLIIEPSEGAEAEFEVDKFGRVISIQVTQSGEGFKTMPKIYINSATGYNATFIPKLCIDRIDEVREPDQDRIITVIDCVGKV